MGACFVKAPAAADGPPIQTGSLVTFRDAAGSEWCATVAGMANGPGNEPWAWLRFNADPRRIEKTPLSDLAAGCEAGANGRPLRRAEQAAAPR